ncbi:sirohydrochlorin chelatase [Streptomyces sp. E11-3]|uniref:sirohydrochlorin chelatase n=1 Tax=Streptomyces sp. E11-3 TaxID=3110112 RepID=UPI0039809EB3
MSRTRTRTAVVSSATRPAPTLVAVGHGTREPAGAAATLELLERIRELRPGLRVEVGWLDLVDPPLTETLAGLTGEAVLVPLLLGTGYHIRVDIPEALATAPHLRTRTARALGPDPLLATALGDLLTEAGRAPGDGPVVLAAAGSTDPQANADTVRMAELLAARLGTPVVPSYLCASAPTPTEAVAELRAQGHEQVALATYLIAPGFFTRRAAGAGARHTSAPLAEHDALARLVLDRYDEAVGDGNRTRSG